MLNVVWGEVGRDGVGGGRGWKGDGGFHRDKRLVVLAEGRTAGHTFSWHCSALQNLSNCRADIWTANKHSAIRLV
jgi:hypothetical protein